MTFSQRLTRAIDFFYPPFRRVMPLQTFRFAACGGSNTLAGWLLYYIFNHWIVAGRWVDLGVVTVAPHTATLYAIVPFTFFAGFWMNRNVAFVDSPLRTRTQLVRYLISWAVSLLLNHLLLKLFVEMCDIWSTPSQVLATLIITVYSYLAQKFFTFRGA